MAVGSCCWLVIDGHSRAGRQVGDTDRTGPVGCRPDEVETEIQRINLHLASMMFGNSLWQPITAAKRVSPSPLVLPLHQAPLQLLQDLQGLLTV
jgi:hypothetical protein